MRASVIRSLAIDFTGWRHSSLTNMGPPIYKEMRRSDGMIGESLMLAIRRRINPSSSNSQSSTP
jgi:hypothetical protein